MAAKCIKCFNGEYCILHPDGPPEGMFPAAGPPMGADVREALSKASLAETKYTELHVRVEALIIAWDGAGGENLYGTGKLKSVFEIIEILRPFVGQVSTPPEKKTRKKRTPKPVVAPDHREKKCGCAHNVTCEHCTPAHDPTTCGGRMVCPDCASLPSVNLQGRTTRF